MDPLKNSHVHSNPTPSATPFKVDEGDKKIISNIRVILKNLDLFQKNNNRDFESIVKQIHELLPDSPIDLVRKICKEVLYSTPPSNNNQAHTLPSTDRQSAQKPIQYSPSVTNVNNQNNLLRNEIQKLMIRRMANSQSECVECILKQFPHYPEKFIERIYDEMAKRYLPETVVDGVRNTGKFDQKKPPTSPSTTPMSRSISPNLVPANEEESYTVNSSVLLRGNANDIVQEIQNFVDRAFDSNENKRPQNDFDPGNQSSKRARTNNDTNTLSKKSAVVLDQNYLITNTGIIATDSHGNREIFTSNFSRSLNSNRPAYRETPVDPKILEFCEEAGITLEEYFKMYN